MRFPVETRRHSPYNNNLASFTGYLTREVYRVQTIGGRSDDDGVHAMATREIGNP